MTEHEPSSHLTSSVPQPQLPFQPTGWDDEGLSSWPERRLVRRVDSLQRQVQENRTDGGAVLQVNFGSKEANDRVAISTEKPFLSSAHDDGCLLFCASTFS